MKKLLLTSIAVIATTAFTTGCKTSNEGSETKQFFEQSTRRTPTKFESAAIGKIRGCTAFFVANDKNLNYVGTARHCINFNITQWCDGGGTVVSEKTGASHQCKSVIGGKTERDIALIEVDGPIHKDVLKLASFAPAPKTNLIMIGYPGDSFQRGKITLTDNCYVHRSDVQSPHTSGGGTNGNALVDRSFTHNCTTYGGNSGGPMIVKGTNIAIGLPFTYQPGSDGRQASSERSEAYGAQMKDFVDQNRAALDEAGVIYANSPADGDLEDLQNLDNAPEVSTKISAFVSQDDKVFFATDGTADSAILCKTKVLEECNQNSSTKIDLEFVSDKDGKSIFKLPETITLESLAESGFVIAGFKKLTKNFHRSMEMNQK